jgi:hypothetical protein
MDRKAKYEIKGTKVISSSGARNFKKEDEKLFKGVVVKDAEQKGHLNIDRSSIILTNEVLNG